jgi:hypothetical protein
LTWRHNSVVNHIAGGLNSTLVGKSTVELYCDLDGLQAPGGGLFPADMVQAQRPDLVILDRSVHEITLTLMLRGPRNISPQDMQISKLLSKVYKVYKSLQKFTKFTKVYKSLQSLLKFTKFTKVYKCLQKFTKVYKSLQTSQKLKNLWSL